MCAKNSPFRYNLTDACLQITVQCRTEQYSPTGFKRNTGLGTTHRHIISDNSEGQESHEKAAELYPFQVKRHTPTKYMWHSIL